MTALYSMMVNLFGKQCIVVGGGKVAERKLASLLDSEANLTVISPDFTPGISRWIKEGRIRGIQRPYSSKDSEGAFLLIAATNVEEVNIAVFRDANARKQLINVVDRPDLSSFINPSTFYRGKLQISVSTSGASPLLAKSICSELEAIYGKEYEIYLDFLSEFRDKVKEKISDPKQREAIYKEMIQADILHKIRCGEFEVYKTEAFKRLGG